MHVWPNYVLVCQDQNNILVSSVQRLALRFASAVRAMLVWAAGRVGRVSPARTVEGDLAEEFATSSTRREVGLSNGSIRRFVPFELWNTISSYQHSFIFVGGVWEDTTHHLLGQVA